MKTLKIIGIILVAIVIVMQLFPSKLPENISDNPNDLLANNQVPDSIAILLKNGCYDCHSNHTNYPWYSNLKPAAWLLGRDIRIGREHLNLSDWETLTVRKKLKALSEISDEVKSGEMPFKPYLLIHKEARFSEEDRQRLVKWTDNFGESLVN